MRLFQYIRRQRNAWSSWRGSPVRDGAQVPPAAHVRYGVYYHHAGRSESVRCTPGQHGREHGVCPQKESGGSRARSQLGQLQYQDPYLTDRQGRPLHLRVMGGPRHDSTQPRDLVETGIGAPLSCLIADRAYDGDAFRVWLAWRDIEVVIPARVRRTHRPHDPARYRVYNTVERDIGWLKHWRRVATRYDTYVHRFLGSLYLAGAMNGHVVGLLGSSAPSWGYIPYYMVRRVRRVHCAWTTSYAASGLRQSFGRIQQGRGCVVKLAKA